jgi:hypothetical protein
VDPSQETGLGTSGLLAIGHLEEGQWQFRLQGDGDFDWWLLRLPQDLLTTDIKIWSLGSSGALKFIQRPWKFVSLNPLQEVLLNLPWKFDQEFVVTNLPGHGHHQGVTREAVDFGTPGGTPLLAIADGTVMSIKDDSNVGGCNPKYADKANHIRIKISDTLAVLYLHTQVNSIAAEEIKVGNKVQAGQVIAKSGWTGFTCSFSGTGPGAHLHIILEKLCSPNSTQVCGSAKLRFEEFEDIDPRYDVPYKSKNRSLRDRRRAKEDEQRNKRLKQLATEQKEKKLILQALGNFYEVYRCGNIIDCKEEEVAKELNWVTQNVRDKLFGYTICLFFCQPRAEKSDSLASVPGSIDYVSFPTPRGDQITIRVKSATRVTIGSEVTVHYNVTNIYLIKVGEKWKADDWEIGCGYVEDEEGEITYTQNLDGCEWKVSGGSSW